jgi:hypothetical protein
MTWAKTRLHGLSFFRIMSAARTNESGMFCRSYEEDGFQNATSNFINVDDRLSASISSSASTSSPGSRPSALISPLASLGRLKLVLRLELRLPCRPDKEEDRPRLESDVRREEGPEVLASVGEGTSGELPLLEGV